ncbi:hypothetical protein TD95_005265 [Thielaviopsis punctulata]|uniref:COP9 signalosome complex subunit 4 n=1 Tax=Thielaviopsis punctulata TaxID=72032 RepID=A0A0F4ZD02_9PEZI|nr:hypothetical protein TD95_005265 [Thielaviopsis punctulata]
MSVSPQVAAALSAIEAQSSDKPSAYQSLITQLPTLSSSDPAIAVADLSAIADSFLNAQLGGIVATRNVLSFFISALKSVSSTTISIPAARHLLQALDAQPSASSLLAQACEVRTLIAAAHEADEDYALAARILAEIPVDTPQRSLAPADTAAVWIRIVRNYLEVDDVAMADTYLAKLIHIMYTVHDPELRLHYALSSARVLDATRRFPDAAARYLEVSNSPLLDPAERLHTLSMAIKCGILAPAGPERTTLLARLYRDERAAARPEFAMLEKMLLQRFIAADEAAAFSQTLQAHQLALTADGTTVLAKAVVEHNLLSASRVYANMRFDALGELLGLSAEAAEKTAARMIEQARLVGSIDQLQQRLVFEKPEMEAYREKEDEAVLSVKDKGRATVRAKKSLKQWDENIRALSENVETIADGMKNKFPNFVAANLKV